MTDEEELIEDLLEVHNYSITMFECMRENAEENIKRGPSVLCIKKENSLIRSTLQSPEAETPFPLHHPPPIQEVIGFG